MKVLARIPLVLRIGLGLILAAAIWYTACREWEANQNWVPFDAVATIKDGHVRTPEFEITMESHYNVWLSMEQDVNSADPAAKPRCPWSLSRNGHVVATGDVDPTDYYSSGFDAGKGRYVLDLDVGSQRGPYRGDVLRLRVEETGGLHRRAEWLVGQSFELLIFLIAAHVVGAILWGAVQLQKRYQDAARVCPLTRPGTHGPCPPVDAAIRHPWETQRPHPHLAALLRLPYIAVGTLWLVLLVPMFMLQSGSFLPRPGLPVRLLRPDVQSPPRIPGLGPVLVQVTRTKTLLVNSLPVTREQLDAVLEKELRLRPHHWPVYVQGDDNLEWQQVVTIIDAVRGQHPHVILLTNNPPVTPNPKPATH